MRRTGTVRIDQSSTLYNRNLRFAMVGAGARAKIAYDSGPKRDVGTMINLTADSWFWDEELQRYAIDFPSGNYYISWGGQPVLGTGPWSVSAWVWPDSGGLFYDGPVCSLGNGGVAHEYAEINLDNTGYLHVDQASSGNSNTFVGALTTDAWNHILYRHPDNSPISDGELWVNGKQASGGGVGSTTLDMTDGSKSMVVGRGYMSSSFNITGKISDLLIFAEQLTQGEASELADRANLSLSGLLTDGRPGPYDLEAVR